MDFRSLCLSEVIEPPLLPPPCDRFEGRNRRNSLGGMNLDICEGRSMFTATLNGDERGVPQASFTILMFAMVLRLWGCYDNCNERLEIPRAHLRPRVSAPASPPAPSPSPRSTTRPLTSRGGAGEQRSLCTNSGALKYRTCSN